MNREKQIDECFCSNCGGIKKKVAQDCPHCNASSRKKKDKELAVVLAIFAGNCGAHHFYLGQPTRAIFSILNGFISLVLAVIYAIPIIIILPVVINVLEIIYLIALNRSKFHEKYSR